MGITLDLQPLLPRPVNHGWVLCPLSSVPWSRSVNPGGTQLEKQGKSFN